MRLMNSMHEESLRPRFCRAPGCRTMFFVCKSCDRGQCYCSHECRQISRLQQKRNANDRYQRTDKGKLTHRLRQCAYRRNQTRLSVTDHGSTSQLQMRIKPASLPPRCAICMRQSDWIDPFPKIPASFFKQLVIGSPARVQKNTFLHDR